MKKYTNKEIQEKISLLENSIEYLKSKRSAITISINDKKEQLNYWSSIDESQLKIL